jgi:hypothetical protein
MLELPTHLIFRPRDFMKTPLNQRVSYQIHDQAHGILGSAESNSEITNQRQIPPLGRIMLFVGDRKCITN